MPTRWNWQTPNWPRFTWDSARLEKAEQKFLFGSGVFFGSLGYLGTDERQRVAMESIADEAVTTSAIEGELLDRDSVQSSVQRHLGLASDRRRVRSSENGIAEMMVDVYRTTQAPLTDAALFAWHRMVMSGHGGVQTIGGYRTHAEPMRVISGRVDAPKVHFEAPPTNRVRAEMSRFLEWFEQTSAVAAATSPNADHNSALPAITRAGLAHLHFVSIHPFEDGNGRIARAIAEKALAQGLGRSSLTAIAATILRQRRAYYEELAIACRTMDATRWLAWFAGIVLESRSRTSANVEFVLLKTRLLNEFGPHLNERQNAALRRMLAEGVDGFEGGMSAAKYVAITGASTATATRDLGGMVEIGVLRRSGERRLARYHLKTILPQVPRVTISGDGEVVEHANPESPRTNT